MVLANKGSTPFTVLWCFVNTEAQDNGHNAEQGKQPHISVHQGPDRHLAQCVLLQARCDHDEPAVFTPVCLRFHIECMASTGMFELKKICKWAAKKKFTHLIILNEKAKKLNACVCATCVPARGPSDMSWLLQHVHQPSALRADCHVQTVVVYAGC